MSLCLKYLKTFVCVAVLFSLTSVNLQAQNVELGKTYKGTASYYSLRFSGRKTASGERLNNKDFTCAHRNLPFGTMLEVENPVNGKWVVVRVNDRGPFAKGRIVDLSFEAAKEIGMIQKGIIKVNAKVVGKDGEILIAHDGATENSYNDIFSKETIQYPSPKANEKKN